MPREANLRELRGERKSSRASPLREALAAILLGLVATGPLWALDWLAERRQEVGQMTPADKEELNEKFDKFESLPPEQQEQLRVLHQNLDNDPQGDRLRGVMHRYYDWLKTLSTRERADLHEATTDADRLVLIKKFKQRQEAFAAKLSGGSHLTLPDVQVLTDWVKKYAAAHEAELLRDMPPSRRGEFPGNDNAERERPAQFNAWRPWLGNKLPNVSKEEIDDVIRHVSAEPRKAIEALPTLHDQAELVHQWLRAIARARFAGAGGSGRQGRNVSPNELARFFAQLPKEKQDELSHIADKDEQRRELRRLYFQHQRSRESSTGSGGDSDQHASKSAPTKQPPDAAKTRDAAKN